MRKYIQIKITRIHKEIDAQDVQSNIKMYNFGKKVKLSAWDFYQIYWYQSAHRSGWKNMHLFLLDDCWKPRFIIDKLMSSRQNSLAKVQDKI